MPFSSSEGSCPPTEVNSARQDPFRSPNSGSATASSPSRPDLTTASPEVQDVLRMIPLNTEARRAFHTVALSAEKGSLDPLHTRYLHVTGKCPLGHLSEATNDSGETTDEVASDPPTMVYAGHFRVHFTLPAISKGPTWIIGKGSGKKFGPTRNVDILLVAPGAKGFPALKAAHVYLGIHPRSGAWTLKAGANMKVEDETVQADKAVCLHQPKTRIEILDMQYLIRFEINTPSLEEDYIKERNRALQKEGYPLPYTQISGIPLQGDTVFESIVFRHGIGSGTFGCVYEGFHPINGELRVAKRIIVKSARDVPDVSREIQALERFGGREGIIELVDWRTALKGKDLLVSQYPLDVYLIHDKGVAFDIYDWSLISWDVKCSLCHQLLLGLTAIHGEGCMHRDITPMNILVFPGANVPQATLCDLGKFCQSPTATDTRLAGWQFLPPELQKEGPKKPYDQTLDIWMLGLALTYCWWPQTKVLHPRNVADYKQMQRVLRHDKAGQVSGAEPLGNLISHMMAWDPSKRPSAVEALKHKSLQEVIAAAKKVHDAASTAKRPHDDSS